MRPVIEITGLRDDDYRCDKCSNRSPHDVRHPVVAFSVLDDELWHPSGARKTPTLYLMTIERANTVIPRYVGVNEKAYLRGRWTRLPGGERHRFRHGDLIHHQPAQIARIVAELTDVRFISDRLRLRLYGTRASPLIDAVRAGTVHAPRVTSRSVPTSADEEYDFCAGVEQDSIDLMYALGLRPWNRTERGDAISTTRALGVAAWSDPRFVRFE